MFTPLPALPLRRLQNQQLLPVYLQVEQQLQIKGLGILMALVGMHGHMLLTPLLICTHTIIHHHRIILMRQGMGTRDIHHILDLKQQFSL